MTRGTAASQDRTFRVKFTKMRGQCEIESIGQSLWGNFGVHGRWRHWHCRRHFRGDCRSSGFYSHWGRLGVERGPGSRSINSAMEKQVESAQTDSDHALTTLRCGPQDQTFAASANPWRGGEPTVCETNHSYTALAPIAAFNWPTAESPFAAWFRLRSLPNEPTFDPER